MKPSNTPTKQPNSQTGIWFSVFVFALGILSFRQGMKHRPQVQTAQAYQSDGQTVEPVVSTPGVDKHSPKTRSPATSGSPQNKAIDPAMIEAGGEGSKEFQEMLRLLNCLGPKANCDFPETDPKSYSLAASKALGAAIDAFRSTKDSLKNNSETRKLMDQAFAYGDGYIQAAVLGWLSDGTPSSENLAILEANLPAVVDPSVMAQSYDVLEKYLNGPYEERVHQLLALTLNGGAHFAGLEGSKKIGTFINEKSLGLYEGVLAQLPSGTVQAKNLSAAVNEYRRLRTGG